MRIIHGSPFAIDWTDLDEVIAYCERLGPGNCVVEGIKTHNYNITHYVRAISREYKILYIARGTPK